MKKKKKKQESCGVVSDVVVSCSLLMVSLTINRLVLFASIRKEGTVRLAPRQELFSSRPRRRVEQYLLLYLAAKSGTCLCWSLPVAPLRTPHWVTRDGGGGEGGGEGGGCEVFGSSDGLCKPRGTICSGLQRFFRAISATTVVCVVCVSDLSVHYFKLDYINQSNYSKLNLM